MSTKSNKRVRIKGRPFEEQYAIVTNLRKRCSELSAELHKVKQELEKEEKDLQLVCDHEFVAEDDEDYHSPSYYYTCVVCDYFTRFRPKTFKH